MSKYVSPELYEKYKNQIYEMSCAIQVYEGTVAVRESHSLTDQEIADKLGLDVNDVTEIRCIAEVEVLPADTWMNSDKWKREQAAKFFDKRRLGGK
jgi:hypothetical protein